MVMGQGDTGGGHGLGEGSLTLLWACLCLSVHLSCIWKNKTELVQLSDPAALMF